MSFASSIARRRRPTLTSVIWISTTYVLQPSLSFFQFFFWKNSKQSFLTVTSPCRATSNTAWMNHGVLKKKRKLTTISQERRRNARRLSFLPTKPIEHVHMCKTLHSRREGKLRLVSRASDLIWISWIPKRKYKPFQLHNLVSAAAIIGDGYRKPTPFLALGLSLWCGTFFPTFRTNCPIPCGARAYMLRGFLRMSRRENSVRNSQNPLCFWPTTQSVYACCNFA